MRINVNTRQGTARHAQGKVSNVQGEERNAGTCKKFSLISSVLRKKKGFVKGQNRGNLENQCGPWRRVRSGAPRTKQTEPRDVVVVHTIGVKLWVRDGNSYSDQCRLFLLLLPGLYGWRFMISGTVMVDKKRRCARTHHLHRYLYKNHPSYRLHRFHE